MSIFDVNLTAKENSEIILSIDSLNLYLFDFKKSIGKTTDNHDFNHALCKFIDDAYFLADAYKKSFNIKHDVIDEVERAGKSILIQKHGKLYEEIIDKKAFVTNYEIEDAYNKMSIIYDLRIYIFNNMKDESYVSGDFVNSFNEKKSDDVQIIRKKMVWPYQYFWPYRDYIYFLEKNKLSKILKLYDKEDSVCCVMIDNKINRDIGELNDDLVSKITKRLLRLKKDILENEYEDSIRKKAKVKINHVECEKLYQHFLRSEEHDDEEFNKIILAEYANNGVIDVNRFLLYRNDQYFKSDIMNINDIYRFIDNIIFDEYAYQHAIQLNLHKKDNFQLNSDNFKNRIILSKYFEEEMLSLININNDEIKEHYLENVKDFTESEITIFSEIIFNSKNDAIRYKIALQNNLLECDELSERSINKYKILHHKKNIKITYNNTIFDRDFTKMLFEMENGTISQPIERDDVFILYRKVGERGSFILDIDDVYDKIDYILTDTKFEKMKKNRLTELKEKYNDKVIINEEIISELRNEFLK